MSKSQPAYSSTTVYLWFSPLVHVVRYCALTAQLERSDLVMCGCVVICVFFVFYIAAQSIKGGESG